MHGPGGIVGQDAAVRAASLILHNSMEGRPSVSLFAAPTGCGKTQIWRVLQREIEPSKINIVIHDASTLTAEGWRGGTKISSIFKSIDPSKREHVILVLDEADKILEPQFGSGGTNYSDILQNQLLRLFDHDTLYFGDEDGKGKGFSVNAEKISIVLLGSFQRLLEKKSRNTGSIGFGASPHQDLTYDNTDITVEDLIDYTGMREEIAGRINRICCMDPLSVDDLARIGKLELDKLSEIMDAPVSIDDDTLVELAHAAKYKGLGARWLKSQLRNSLDDLIYEDPGADAYQLQYTPSDTAERRQVETQMN